MSSQLAQSLARGVDELRVEITPSQSKTLLDFLALLERWNRAYNLTAVRDPAQMVSRHLLDSLSIVSLVRGKTLLDVGSGAGLPGLVLAVAMPQLKVTLLDPALKRTRFLTHATHELGLDNVQVERARIEDFIPSERFDTITSRATAALQALVESTMDLLSDDGRLVAMLGKAPRSEMGKAALSTALGLCEHRELQIERLRVPGIDAARHAAVIGTKI